MGGKYTGGAAGEVPWHFTDRRFIKSPELLKRGNFKNKFFERTQGVTFNKISHY